MKPVFMSATAAALLLAGCTDTVRVREPPAYVIDEPDSVVVREPPPAVREEIVPIAPGPGYLWRPGRWRWHDGWGWEGGAYIARPLPEAEWEPGHWAERRYGWAWIPGHWR